MNSTSVAVGGHPLSSITHHPMPDTSSKNSANSLTGVISSITLKTAAIGIALLATATIIYFYPAATLLCIAGLGAFYIYRSYLKPNPSSSVGDEKKTTPQATQNTQDKRRLKELEDAANANRCGEGSVKRDWRVCVDEKKYIYGFPDGEAYRDEFTKAFLNFESFACDVNTTLQDYLGIPESDVTKVLIEEVFSPLYENCQTYVKALIQSKKNALGDTGSDNSIFWRERRQAEMLSVVKALSDPQIETLMKGGLLQKVHEKMLQAAKDGRISNMEIDLRIPVVIRSLLSMMMIAEMSCPRCYVFPKPGTKLKYREGETLEILSPGTKKYGRIQENADVEVVLPGLYFNDPTEFPDEKPLNKVLVRRLKLDQK